MGVGFPELLNAEIRYRILDQAELGASIGWWPPSGPGYISWTNLFSISGDLYYHFAGKSEYTEIKPWYGRIGINCIMEEGGWWFSYFRIGREFNLDEENAICIDAGLFYHLNNKTTGIIPVFVATGAGFSYRF